MMKTIVLIAVLGAAFLLPAQINNGGTGLPTLPTTPNGVAESITSTPSGGVGVAAVWSLPGVATNAQTGTTYTIAATDRAGYVSFSNAGAIAVTLPQAGSTGFANNFVMLACDIGAGTATITPTTSTISYTTKSAYTAAAASLALTTGQCAWIYADNSNYFAVVPQGTDLAHAGYYSFGQGPDPTALFPATAFSIYSGTSQTAVNAKTPSAPPTNNNSVWTFSNAIPSIGAFAKMQSVAFQTSAYTNATTTFSNATGLSFAVEASTNYAAECHVYFQASVGTAGIKAQFTGPASPTAVNIALHQPLTASTYSDAVATAFSSSLGVTTTTTATTNFEAVITIGLLNGANAGTVQLQLAAEGVGTLTSNVGSYCKWQ